MDKAELTKWLPEICAELRLKEIPSRWRRLFDDDPPPPKFPCEMGARSTPRYIEFSEDVRPRRLRA